jgi:hypothetical protein
VVGEAGSAHGFGFVEIAAVDEQVAAHVVLADGGVLGCAGAVQC